MMQGTESPPGKLLSISTSCRQSEGNWSDRSNSAIGLFEENSSDK